MTRRGPACLAAAAALVAPLAARANDLGGLAYVVFVWPIGIVLLLASIVLGGVGLRLRGRITGERRYRGFAIALIAVGGIEGLGYPLATLALDRSFDAGAPLGLALVTVIPAILAAAALVALGLSILRRARSGIR